MNKERIKIRGELQHSTANAYLLFDGFKAVWVPKSFVDYDGENTFIMPEWLAKEKGLI